MLCTYIIIGVFLLYISLSVLIRKPEIIIILKNYLLCFSTLIKFVIRFKHGTFLKDKSLLLVLWQSILNLHFGVLHWDGSPCRELRMHYNIQITYMECLFTENKVYYTTSEKIHSLLHQNSTKNRSSLLLVISLAAAGSLITPNFYRDDTLFC